MIYLATILVISSCVAIDPIVVSTWKFTNATQNAWNVLQQTGNALDALEVGCQTCQDLQCDYTVGFGGSPDENGETTLDALIFDGNNVNMGAVGSIRKIKDAVGVARRVLENTRHSFLIGEQAAQFAESMGFKKESLQTNYSIELWQKWKDNNCQPNFWLNVVPDPTSNCGPYHSTDTLLTNEIPYIDSFNSHNHDTIGMIIASKDGHLVAGTSTNGANHKIPGRVGDSPIPGAGAYADSEAGAAVCTGDGDVMMRFLPSFLAVEQMRQGVSPQKAAKVAISRITKKYPTFVGAIIAVDTSGEIGAACNGIELFPYSIMVDDSDVPSLKYVTCSNGQ